VGTARGVDRLEPESGRFKHFSVADGLAGSEVIAAFRDRAGALWFGTFTGISRLVPQPDVARGPPTAWIAGLRIRGVAQQLEHLGQPQIALRNLEPHQNQVQIDYFGLSPAPGEPLRYQYQLEGADSAWTAPTLERTINYAELAPGSYRFLVRAVDVDGHSSSPASVSFTILPPVWKRWWFFTTLTLLALASAYSVHRYRVTRLLEMERLRTRIASDLHDDLGSSLSQISILSEVVRAHLGNPEARIADPLTRIGTLSRESVDSMGDIVWAIDPLRDTPVHLLQRMRRVANELLGAAGVQLWFDSSGDASPALNADVRRHAFLIFKEILNNVVRHADATTVTVAVTIASRQLHLTVTDDGRGFDVAAHREGQGLRSMQRRATVLGGSMGVTSAPGTGTRVTLTLPVR
jgi:signal transduction histidine kinase